MVAPFTSGQTDYTSSAYRIVASALRKCGVIAEGEVPEAGQAESTLEALNAMVSGWQASGIHVWAEEEAILFAQKGQRQYSLGATSTDHACLYADLIQSGVAVSAVTGATSVLVNSIAGLAVGMQFAVQMDDQTNFWTTIASAPAAGVVPLADALPGPATSGQLTFAYGTELLRPLRVPQGRRYLYLSKITNTLITLSRLDYDNLANQDATGQPNQFFYDPQTGNGAYSAALGIMNLWPVPSDNTVGIRFVSQRPLQYFRTLANIPDFPAEWTAALIWNLAQEIGPEFDIIAERWAMIEKQAGIWFARCASWDREPEPIFFGMAMSPGYR